MRESIIKFHKGKDNLDTLFMSQRPLLVRHGLRFNECLTSCHTSSTAFVKSSSPPQTFSVDLAKIKGRKPKSKQKDKPSIGSLAKRSKTSKGKPKGKLQGKSQSKPKGKPLSKGQTPKKHHTRQKAMSKRTSSPNVHCHYCMKRGHINVFCHIRREHLSLGTFVDANLQGPKYIWVPKSR